MNVALEPLHLRSVEVDHLRCAPAEDPDEQEAAAKKFLARLNRSVTEVDGDGKWVYFRFEPELTVEEAYEQEDVTYI